jgi:hypothetical protein
MEKSVFRRLLYGSSGKKFSRARRSKALEFRASHWRLSAGVGVACNQSAPWSETCGAAVCRHGQKAERTPPLHVI